MKAKPHTLKSKLLIAGLACLVAYGVASCGRSLDVSRVAGGTGEKPTTIPAETTAGGQGAATPKAPGAGTTPGGVAGMAPDGAAVGGAGQMPPSDAAGTGGADDMPLADAGDAPESSPDKGCPGDAGRVRTAFGNRIVTGSWPQLAAGTADKPICQKQGSLEFRKVNVHSRHLGESCTFGDYDGDGVVDVSAGRYWYKGPDFQQEHVYRDGHDDLTKGNVGDFWADGRNNNAWGISDSWASWAWDMDGDGLVDIVNASNPGWNHTESGRPKMQDAGSVFWYKNPGPARVAGRWAPQLLTHDFTHETHGMFDADGDGNPEFYGLCTGCNQNKGYYFGNWASPRAAWTFAAGSRKPLGTPTARVWLHGLGAGDFNQDGRPDFLDPDGIWLQQEDGTFPVSSSIRAQMQRAGGPDAAKGGAQMYTADFDGDEDMDIFSADDAHGFGLAWYEQAGERLIRHQFLGDKSPEDVQKYGLEGFSHPHSAEVLDMDGDGTPDIVTGRMKFAQPYGARDLDNTGEPVLYIFATTYASVPQSGQTTFTPTLVDKGPGSAGVGRHFTVGHIDDDGVMDFCISAEGGLYVFFGQ